MLTVNYIDDESVLTNLYDKLELHEHGVSGINAVLFEEERPIGVCKMMLTDEGCEIINFKILKEKDGFAVTDFFFRTVLFKLSKSTVTVLVRCADERLKKFGFKQKGEYMAVDGDEIQFPSSCGH